MRRFEDLFENDVKMYGTQAEKPLKIERGRFENDVKMYGTQAPAVLYYCWHTFENDVKMYGTQAILTEVHIIP